MKYLLLILVIIGILGNVAHEYPILTKLLLFAGLIYITIRVPYFFIMTVVGLVGWLLGWLFQHPLLIATIVLATAALFIYAGRKSTLSDTVSTESPYEKTEDCGKLHKSESTGTALPIRKQG